ncbi:MAG: NAD(P)/FAD-dependent oxidoreductase [Alphaproteobacteria bacterium]|nr:NAD(P)/FAD-dependent oxidoreductase [Alphaproteobacteria bacterium]
MDGADQEDPPALRALAAEAHRQLAQLEYPTKPWVLPRAVATGETAPYDAVVVGAGQGGLAVAFGLLRARVTNILVIDSAAEGSEGPWVTTARMTVLRSPKHQPGPELGVPALSPRAWYEATYGAAAWDAIVRIPREVWMAYLRWFRRTVGLAVRNRTTLTAIAPAADDLLALTIETDGAVEHLRTRKLVLATGMEGSGGLSVPDILDPALPRARWHHGMEPIDFTALAGKRLGVLGHGASAFDNAATALEAGAASADLFFRRPKLPRVNPHKWFEKAGFLRHFADMPDALKWRFWRHIDLHDQPPPREAYARCIGARGFAIHPGTPWRRVSPDGDGVRVETPRGDHRFDHVILATGPAMDPGLRPELAPFADRILRWADRYTPPPELAHPEMGKYAYLGPDFALQPRDANAAPWLRHIFYFAFGATLSMGYSGASITGLRYGADRLVAGVTRGLWLDDVEAQYHALETFDEIELVLPDDIGH